MKRSLFRAGSCALLVVPLLGVPAASAPAEVAAATVDPGNVRVANFEGWGTALAWGANAVGGWSDAKRTKIADLLFSRRDGLGLNIGRYHIGAGQASNWQALGCGEQRPGSPVPTHQPAQGSWDWTADANQRWFAQAAQRRGVNRWLAYASAPPSWMTINGCTNGGDGGGQNLKGWWGYDGDGTGAHNSTTSYSNSTGDSVTVRFNGTQISFYAAKSADSGHAAISVDGGAETTVDLYSATRQGNQRVYTSDVLPSGTHTLKVRVTGTKRTSSTGYFVSPDRVVIDGTSVDDQVRGTGLNQFNYHWNMYEPYADYLTEVTKHYRDSWGINFDLLDPLNEPENAWSKTGNQEGCHFDQGSQNEIVNRVGQSLAAKGLTRTTVAAPDGFSVGSSNSDFKSYSTSAKNYISTINTHTYGTNSSDVAALRDTAAAYHKKIWMSEYGTGEVGIGQPPGGMDPVSARPAVNLAARIVGDLSELRPKAWVLWDGIESWEMNEKEDVSWGLIWGRYNDPNETYTVAKQYYGYGNFTKFVRPGYQIIDSGDSQTLAAYDPVGGRVVLVAYNNTDTARSVSYDLSKFQGISAATPHRTSDTEKLAKLPDIAVAGNSLSATLNPKSITTYVMNAKSELTAVNDRNTGTGRNQFDYSGAWSNTSEDGAYLGDNSWSGAANADYKVRFNGTKVDLYGAKAPNHGIAAVSIDGGPETNVDFYAPARADNTRVYSSPTLAAGDHTIRVRVTGTKNANSSGVAIPADRVDVSQPGGTRLNDSASGAGTNQFEYTGSWGYGAELDAYGGDNHWSGATNASYQVRFNGAKADLYGSTAPNHGIAAVSIDGGPETTVDFYASTRRDNELVWSSPVLANGAHTLTVRVTGAKNSNSTGAAVPADRVDVFAP